MVVPISHPACRMDAGYPESTVPANPAGKRRSVQVGIGVSPLSSPSSHPSIQTPTSADLGCKSFHFLENCCPFSLPFKSNIEPSTVVLIVWFFFSYNRIWKLSTKVTFFHKYLIFFPKKIFCLEHHSHEKFVALVVKLQWRKLFLQYYFKYIWLERVLSRPGIRKNEKQLKSVFNSILRSLF